MEPKQSSSDKASRPDTPTPASSSPPDPSTHSESSSTETKPISSWAIRAYLGLRAKLSQAPFSYLIIFMCVQVWRLFQQKQQVDELAEEARQAFAEDCRSVERQVATLQQFPIYAAIGASRAVRTAINKSVQDLVFSLTMFLDGIVETIRMVIELLTGTWRCFLSELTTSSIPFMPTIGNAGLSIIDSTTNSLVTTLSGPFSGLNNTVHAELGNKTFVIDENVLHAPKVQTVEFCTALINKISLDFITGLLNKVFNIGLYILAGLIFLLLLWNIFSIKHGHKSWLRNVERTKKLLNLWYSINPPQGNIQPSKQQLDEKPSPDSQDPSTQEQGVGESQIPMDEVAARLYRLSTIPLLFGPLEYILRRYCPNNPKRQARILWFFDYITQRAGIVCLKIGVVGLILVHLKLYAIKRVREDALDAALRESVLVLGDIAKDMATVSDKTSVALALSINQAIQLIEADINVNVVFKIMDGLQTLSGGLETAENTLVKGIESAFGQNFLSASVVASLRCSLLRKLERVRKGIDHVERNIYVSFPRLDPKQLMVDPNRIETAVNNALSELNGQPANGNSTTPQDPNNSPLVIKIRDAASKMLNKIERDLYQERILYIGLASVWVYLFLVAIITICVAPVAPVAL
ncbi:plasma membrane fusion protein prm1 [Actinomortierella wolfii]|nr:plasma membrane fusion protein prm1 [Actinomortierella wolfii]